MTSTPHDPKDEHRLDRFTEVARTGVESRSEEELDQGLNVLLGRVAAGQAHGHRRAGWILAGAVAAACALVGLSVVSTARQRLRASEPAALAYRIEGGTVLEGGYLRESGHTGITLSFNEGSQFALMPGTRGRLRGVDRAGARIAIDHGMATFQVTQNSDRRWIVEAGPFLVTVKGTVFTVSWDPSNERFELGLRRGRVVVSGPVSGGDIVLRAGQRLVVNLSESETLILEDKPEVGASEAEEAVTALPQPALRPAVMKAKSASPGAASLSSLSSLSSPSKPAMATKIESERRWADDLANGQWDRILEDVERTGTKAALDKASSEDLFALANAARFRRRMDLARAALLAERRRFPASPRALDALFLLGRVDESGDSGRTRAITWYDEYLSHAPAGAYAAEALGRKMTLTSEVAGPDGARPIAEEYLRRFPKGSYAGSARALRRAP